MAESRSLQRLTLSLAALVFLLGPVQPARAGTYSCSPPAHLISNGARCSDGTTPIYKSDTIAPVAQEPQESHKGGEQIRGLNDLPEVDSDGLLQGLDAFQAYPNVSIEKCARLQQCEWTKGMQTGQADVSVTGEFPKRGGQTVFEVILDKRHHLRYKGMAGIVADGRLSASAPVGNLPQGRYELLFVPRNEGAKAFAGMIFDVERESSGQTNPPSAGANGGSPSPAGNWRGINGTAGLLTVKDDGTYAFNGTRGGTYSVSGNHIRFTGDLSAWGGGYATFNDNSLEFTWTRSDGASQWMSFGR